MIMSFILKFTFKAVEKDRKINWVVEMSMD